MSTASRTYDYRRLSKKNALYKTQIVTVANGARFVALRVTAADIRVLNNALYMHVRRETSQCYLGITEQRVADRWGVGNGYRQQKKFGAAIRRHGWHAFEHYVLAVAGSRKALERAEMDAIQNAGGHKSPNTYNLSPGGDLVAENDRPLVGTHLPTGKERKFRSSSDAARKLGFTNTDAASAVARKERTSTEDWWFKFEDDLKSIPPRVWGEELRRRQIRQIFGKPVVAVNLKTKKRTRFNTQAEAEAALGINQTLISQSVTKRSHSAAGYVFFNEGEAETLPKLYGSKATRKKRDKAVYATNLKVGKKRKFRNCTVADTELNLHTGAAASVASGERASAGGWWFTFSRQDVPPKEYGGRLVAIARRKAISATEVTSGKTWNFDSAKSASERLGMSRAGICKAVSSGKPCKGYLFGFATPDSTN